MGKRKYIDKIEGLFKRSPVVYMDSISRIVKSEKKVKQYNKQLIRNLILSSRVKRLTKGCYTIHNDIALTVFCFKPAYLGLQDALSAHNLWEQESIPVIVTTRKVRQGIRKVLGANILIRRINKKYFFGFKYKKQGNFYLPISDIEKTFIDMIYFKEKLSGELMGNCRKIINKKKLMMYAKRYPNNIHLKIVSLFNS